MVVLPPTLGLYEQLLLGADELRVFFGADAFLQRDEALEALLNNLLGHLVIHLSGRGTGARRVLEGKRGGKARLLHHVEGVLEVLLRLAGEADNDIGRQRGVRQFFAHLVQDAEELLRAIRAAHVFKHLVGARLQRHVQLRAHIQGLGHRVNHIGGKFRRVRGGKAHPLQALDLTAGAQELGKGRAVAL